MRLRKLALLTAISALLLAPLASTALAANGMEIGVQDDGVFTGPPNLARKAMVAAAHIKATYVRVFLPWADIAGSHANSRRAPKHPHYNFHGYDSVVFLASQYGIKVQFVLTGPAPAWATGNHRKGAVSPKSGPFAEYARQAAVWFRGRVQRWSVWNEPNYISWLQPQKRAASIYRALYQRGYAAIKSVDPTDTVLIGETSPYASRRLAIAPLAFLRSVLCVNRAWQLKHGCSGLIADGYAQHPYDFNHPPSFRYPGADDVTMGTLNRLTSALSRAAGSGALRTPAGGTLPVYLTEYGYLSSGHSRISDKKYARYIVQGFGIALANPSVRETVQYTLLPPRGRYRFFDMSILTSRGKPRAPYKALQKWVNKMAAAGRIAVP
jgi:hypothetical protein